MFTFLTKDICIINNLYILQNNIYKCYEWLIFRYYIEQFFFYCILRQNAASSWEWAFFFEQEDRYHVANPCTLKKKPGKSTGLHSYTSFSTWHAVTHCESNLTLISQTAKSTLIKLVSSHYKEQSIWLIHQFAIH